MALKIRCKDHPKYQGIMVPTVLCNACWYLFHIRQFIRGSDDKRLQFQSPGGGYVGR